MRLKCQCGEGIFDYDSSSGGRGAPAHHYRCIACDQVTRVASSHMSMDATGVVELTPLDRVNPNKRLRSKL